ncbi:MAG: DUF4838 domain-containing protein [Lentisphaerae bacterium]|nr:DUF4838 domain-containing protein [Lentisphaerota bacterium]
MLKSTRIALFVLLLASVFASAQRFSPNAVSPRRRVIQKQDYRTADFAVVLPANAAPATKLAATELSQHLGRALGKDIPVGQKAPEQATALILGDYALAEKHGLQVSSLDRDGYFIKTIPEGVLLLGQDEPGINPLKNTGECATLFAVYDFLETVIGARFYFPGEMGVIIPRHESIDLPLLDICERPDSQYRRMYVVNWGGPSGPARWFDDGDQRVGQKMANLYYRLQTRDIPNCHGLAYLGLKNRFAKTNPEYFAMRQNGTRQDGTNITHPNDRNGHICFSSEGLKNELYLDAEAFLTGKSAESRGIIMDNGKSYWNASRFQRPFFNLMPADSCFPCQCPDCKPHFQNDNPQEKSNYIWKFKTDIARRLQENNIPGYLTMMAYSMYRPIPDVDIPSNVLVMLATPGPWAERLPQQKQYDQLLQDWNRKLDAKTYLWTYITKASGKIPHIPNFTPKVVGQYFSRQSPYIFGAFIEAETDYWLFGYLNYYVFSKVMWDAKTDYLALLEEHNQLMFGPGAEEMAAFQDALEKHWFEDIMSNIVDTDAGPVAVTPSSYDLWNKIYSPEEVERINGLFERAEQKTAAVPEALARVRFYREQLWQPVLTGWDLYRKQLGDRDSWLGYMPPLAAEDKIVIDGMLSEAAWKQFPPLVLLPFKAETLIDQTRFYCRQDAENFYFAVECEEPNTDRMLASERKFDDPKLWQDNSIEIFLNPDGSRKKHYQIIINNFGNVTDGAHQPGSADWSWNAGAECKTAVVPGKMWTLEVRIPRSSMEAAQDKLVANFSRNQSIRDETATIRSCWSPYAKGFHNVENYGSLLFTAPPATSLLKDSDFSAPLRNKRFVGAWHSHPVINQDRQCFRTAGVSIRLDESSQSIGQYLTDLQPGARYRLSFYIKTQDLKAAGRGGYYVKIDWGNGIPNTFPRNAYNSDMPWTRQEFEFTAPAEIGTRSKPYLRFQRHNITGTAWIDQAELHEITATQSGD